MDRARTSVGGKNASRWQPHQWVYADGTTREPITKRQRRAAQEATRVIDKLIYNRG